MKENISFSGYYTKSSACVIVLQKYFKSIIGYSFLLLLLSLLDSFLNVMDLLALLSVSMVESYVKKEQDIFKYSLEYLSLENAPKIDFSSIASSSKLYCWS